MRQRVRGTDVRSTHDGWSRSPRTDGLAMYRAELERGEMDPELKAHLVTRLRRAMNTYRTVTERDFALVAERLYAATVDPTVPAAERRRALGSWFNACKHLELVARRSKPAQRSRSIFLGAKARRRAVVAAEVGLEAETAAEVRVGGASVRRDGLGAAGGGEGASRGVPGDEGDEDVDGDEDSEDAA